MSNGDPRDGFFYPTLTPMIDSSTLGPRIKKKKNTAAVRFKALILLLMIHYLLFPVCVCVCVCACACARVRV